MRKYKKSIKSIKNLWKSIKMQFGCLWSGPESMDLGPAPTHKLS